MNYFNKVRKQYKLKYKKNMELLFERILFLDNEKFTIIIDKNNHPKFY